MSENHLNFLFWNLNKKELSETVCRLVSEHHVDILILTELMSVYRANILMKLNEKRNEFFVFSFDRITVYTRFNKHELQTRYEDKYFVIQELNIGNTSVWIVALHLRSKLYQTENSQYQFATEIKRKIESRIGYRENVVFVGDFNLNPFEVPMVAAGGFHAIADREIATSKTPIIAETKYPMLYNPMWNFFGDANGHPAKGTYFYKNAQHVNYYWNIFDQVLLGKKFAKSFDSNKIQIVTSCENHSFLNSKGFIDSKNYSDHLPLKFSLNL